MGTLQEFCQRVSNNSQHRRVQALKTRLRDTEKSVDVLSVENGELKQEIKRMETAFNSEVKFLRSTLRKSNENMSSKVSLLERELAEANANQIELKVHYEDRIKRQNNTLIQTFDTQRAEISMLKKDLSHLKTEQAEPANSSTHKSDSDDLDQFLKDCEESAKRIQNEMSLKLSNLRTSFKLYKLPHLVETETPKPVSCYRQSHCQSSDLGLCSGCGYENVSDISQVCTQAADCQNRNSMLCVNCCHSQPHKNPRTGSISYFVSKPEVQ